MIVISSKKDILMLLDEFAEYMPRLAQKVDSIDAYAEKLSQFAKIVVEVDENNKKKGLVIFYANDMKTYNGFISLIVVKEEFRSTGIGKILLQYACDIMRSEHMERVGLIVDKSNSNAFGFYKHLGFDMIREESSGYFMQKSL